MLKQETEAKELQDAIELMNATLISLQNDIDQGIWR
jgi:hypothetical protein